MSNCKIQNLIFQIFLDSQLQKLWEKLLFGQFCVANSFPLLKMLRNNEQKLSQAMLWVCNIIQGERGRGGKGRSLLFKMAIIFCHWIDPDIDKYRYIDL